MRILLHHTANKYLNRLTPEDKARFNAAFQIEPATPEESARAERRVREYHKNPASFVPLESIK
jgi:hypothetical protein